MGPELPNGQTLNYKFSVLPLLICASLLKKEGSNLRGTKTVFWWLQQCLVKNHKLFTKTPKENPQLFWGVKKNNEKSPALDNISSFLEKIPGNCEKFPPCIERCGPARCEGFPPGSPSSCGEQSAAPEAKLLPGKRTSQRLLRCITRDMLIVATFYLYIWYILSEDSLPQNQNVTAFKKKTLHHDPFRLKQNRNDPQKQSSIM